MEPSRTRGVPGDRPPGAAAGVTITARSPDPVATTASTEAVADQRRAVRPRSVMAGWAIRHCRCRPPRASGARAGRPPRPAAPRTARASASPGPAPGRAPRSPGSASTMTSRSRPASRLSCWRTTAALSDRWAGSAACCQSQPPQPPGSACGHGGSTRSGDGFRISTASARASRDVTSVTRARTVSPGSACRTNTTGPSSGRATHQPPWATSPGGDLDDLTGLIVRHGRGVESPGLRAGSESRFTSPGMPVAFAGEFVRGGTSRSFTTRSEILRPEARRMPSKGIPWTRHPWSGPRSPWRDGRAHRNHGLRTGRVDAGSHPRGPGQHRLGHRQGPGSIPQAPLVVQGRSGHRDRLRPGRAHPGGHRARGRLRRGQQRRQLQHHRRPGGPRDVRGAAGGRADLRPAPGRGLRAARHPHRGHGALDRRPDAAQAAPGGRRAALAGSHRARSCWPRWPSRPPGSASR